MGDARMRTLAFIVILEILIGETAAANGPSGLNDKTGMGVTSAESEFAWARRMWPNDLSTVHEAAPSSKLVEWLHGRPTATVYLLDEEHRCEKSELSVATYDQEEDGLPSESGRDLKIKTDFRYRIRNGRRFRTLTVWAYGHDFGLHRSGVAEDADGRDDVAESVSCCDESMGVLSFVDDHMAVFGGIPVSLAVSCGGQSIPFQCKRGGIRLCPSCETISVSAYPSSSEFGMIRPQMDSDTCTEQCPSPTTPDAKRLRRLAGSVLLWEPAEPGAVVPVIFRSRNKCRAAYRDRRSRIKNYSGNDTAGQVD